MATKNSKFTESFIKLLPGSFTLDAETKQRLKSAKNFLHANIEHLDISQYDGNNTAQVWLDRFQKIETPEEFNIFMKIYWNFVLPMKSTNYMEILEKLIKSMGMKKTARNKIVEIVDFVRKLLDWMEKKFAGNREFLVDADG